MMMRCYDENNWAYKHYGGRGIGVCDRWHNRVDYVNDVKHGFELGLEIDRIDNDGDYCPENIHWATRLQQVRNSSQPKHIVVGGVSKQVAEWAEELGIDRRLILSRLSSGWDGLEALGLKARPPIVRSKKSDIHPVSEKHYLGDLCIRGHKHNGSGQSKRFISTRQCVECQNQHLRKYREQRNINKSH